MSANTIEKTDWKEVGFAVIGVAGFFAVTLLITFFVISHRSIDSTASAGVVLSVERYPGNDTSGIAVIGGRFGFWAGGSPDRALVVTDKRRYLLDGLASELTPGVSVDLRISADRTNYLCPANDYSHCYQVNP